MNRRLLVVPALFALAGTACAPPPKKGIVISTEYNRAHYNTYLYCGHYSTTTTRSASGSISTSTTCDVWLPAQYWVPDSWSLKLKDGKHKGWRKVPQSVYSGPCGHLGVFYPDCAT